MAKTKNTTVWTLVLLEETFGLQQLPVSEEKKALTHWLEAGNTTIPDTEVAYLDELRILLADNVEDWDEEDLKMNFIVFILKQTNYVQYKGEYRVFFEKYISATIEHHVLSS